ncbi:hypothetical protein PG985_015551 [Apiospora marii]|uniref:uncharacterized protein n=1 Tax=Apiospora marii TaxID=335849 RepID=UPI00312CF18C
MSYPSRCKTLHSTHVKKCSVLTVFAQRANSGEDLVVIDYAPATFSMVTHGTRSHNRSFKYDAGNLVRHRPFIYEPNKQHGPVDMLSAKACLREIVGRWDGVTAQPNPAWEEDVQTSRGCCYCYCYTYSAEVGIAADVVNSVNSCSEPQRRDYQMAIFDS